MQGKDAAYTVFSVATQHSSKKAQGEWQTRTGWHRAVAWNRLGELATARLRSGDHVHIQGRLVSSTYDKRYRNGKNPTVVNQTFWRVRANSIRKLNRTEFKGLGICRGPSSLGF